MRRSQRPGESGRAANNDCSGNQRCRTPNQIYVIELGCDAYVVSTVFLVGFALIALFGSFIQIFANHLFEHGGFLF
jgi:hypothetical protein